MISRSVAQIATASMRTSTSAGPGCGTGFSVGRISPGPPSTHAFICSGTGYSLLNRAAPPSLSLRQRRDWRRVLARCAAKEKVRRLSAMRGLRYRKSALTSGSGDAQQGGHDEKSPNRGARRVGLYRPLCRPTARRPRRRDPGRLPPCRGRQVPDDVRPGRADRGGQRRDRRRRAAAGVSRRQRCGGQLRRHSAARAVAQTFERVHHLGPGADGAGRARGRGRAARPHFGDRRRSALALGLCANQGGGRGGGARRVSDRDDPAPVGRVRAGGPVLQPLCRRSR